MLRSSQRMFLRRVPNIVVYLEEKTRNGIKSTLRTPSRHNYAQLKL